VRGRNLSAFGKVVLAFAVLLLGADSVMAYVGPGADMAFLSYAMTLLAWVLVAFSAILLWPVYALLRKIRGEKKNFPPLSPIQTTPQEDRGASPLQP
jgi:hypothetical protein